MSVRLSVDMAKKIITADGSVSFYNEQLDESYHSNTGAIEESFLKFVKPAVDMFLEKNPSAVSISVLDMFYGLGYNSLCMTYYLREIKRFMGDIRLVGLELDTEIMEFSKDIKFADEVNSKMLDDAGIRIDPERFNHYYSNLDVKVIIGDARMTVKAIDERFDVIIFDPFSPKKQPELWTETFFHDVSLLAKKGTILTTYSCARVTKDGLAKAGFIVSKGPSVGRKAPSTVAVFVPF